MKMALSTIVLAIVSFSAGAAEVKNATVVTADDGTYALAIQVRYGGGCKEHKFKLELGNCFESMPVQCFAELQDLTTDDFCEALISETIQIPFSEAGLNDSYFSGGSLAISGDRESSAAVELPQDL